MKRSSSTFGGPKHYAQYTPGLKLRHPLDNYSFTAKWQITQTLQNITTLKLYTL